MHVTCDGMYVLFYLDVRHVGQAGRPRLRERVEEPVGHVEAAALQRDVLRRVRLEAQQVVQHDARRRGQVVRRRRVVH